MSHLLEELQDTISGEITKCYNTGDVSSKKSYAGGISAYAYPDAKINNCYSIGNITATAYLGGIVGYKTYKDNVVINCYYAKQNNLKGAGNTDLYDITCYDIDFFKTNEFIKMLNQFGNIWKEDTENINKGYPIFIWQ